MDTFTNKLWISYLGYSESFFHTCITISIMSYIRHIFTLFLKPKSSEGRDTARAMFPAIRIKPENWKIQMIYKFIDRISNKVSVLEYVIEVWNSFSVSILEWLQGLSM